MSSLILRSALRSPFNMLFLMRSCGFTTANQNSPCTTANQNVRVGGLLGTRDVCCYHDQARGIHGPLRKHSLLHQKFKF